MQQLGINLNFRVRFKARFTVSVLVVDRVRFIIVFMVRVWFLLSIEGDVQTSFQNGMRKRLSVCVCVKSLKILK